MIFFLNFDLDVTFVTCQLMYWVEFDDEKYKSMENIELIDQHPDLVIEFLQRRLEIANDSGFDGCMRKSISI